MSALGCGRRVTIHMLGGPNHHAVHVDCGSYYLGELIQCEECQESKPWPAADPEDPDAQAELKEERRFIDSPNNPRWEEREDPPDGACTNPGGHEWNRTAGEADEARIAGDYENDNIRCIHCGADGDA